MRFWQAIRNWSKAGKILFEKTNKETIDTFYWEGKNEGEIAERQHNKWRKLYFKMFKEWNEKSLKIKKE